MTRDGRFVPAVDDASRSGHCRPGDVELPEVEFEGETVEFTFDGSENFSKRMPPASAQVWVWLMWRLRFCTVRSAKTAPFRAFLNSLVCLMWAMGFWLQAAGMDKEFTKALFLQAGVPAVPHVVVHAHEWSAEPAEVLERVRGLGGLPLR
jgi:hypothetical protein